MHRKRLLVGGCVGGRRMEWRRMKQGRREEKEMRMDCREWGEEDREERRMERREGWIADKERGGLQRRRMDYREGEKEGWMWRKKGGGIERGFVAVAVCISLK